MRKIRLKWVDALDKDHVFATPQTRIYEAMPDGSWELVELEIQYVNE